MRPWREGVFALWEIVFYKTKAVRALFFLAYRGLREMHAACNAVRDNVNINWYFANFVSDKPLFSAI